MENQSEAPRQIAPESVDETLPKTSPSKLPIILLVILLLFLFGAGGIFFGKFLYTTQNIPIPTLAPKPTKISTTTPTIYTEATPTASWKIYKNDDLEFKYPNNWTESGYVISSADPKIRLVVSPRDGTLMVECMQQTTTENKNNLYLKKFSAVTTGARCSGEDPTAREIWVIPKASAYTPGISYQYSSSETAKAELIFDQILFTFKFTQ
jgi:hypothetical protein